MAVCFRSLVEHLRVDEFRRSRDLGFSYVSPGRREAVYRSENDVQAGDGQQQREVPRMIDVKKAERFIKVSLRRRQARVIGAKAFDVLLHDDHADDAAQQQEHQHDDAETHRTEQAQGLIHNRLIRSCGSSGCTLLVARRRRIHVDFCFHCRHRFTFLLGDA